MSYYFLQAVNGSSEVEPPRVGSIEISWNYMSSDYKSIAMYGGIGLILITVSISLLVAVYRSKVIRRHMSGVLLANLALVGIFSFWSDVAVELERELMERSIMLGEIGRPILRFQLKHIFLHCHTIV